MTQSVGKKDRIAKILTQQNTRNTVSTLNILLITYIGSNGTNDEPKSPNIYYTAFAALGVLIALVFIILLFSVIVRHWTQRRGRSKNQQKHVQLLEFRRKTECEDAKVFNQDINVNGTHTLSKTLSNKDLFANEDITKEVIITKTLLRDPHHYH